MPDQPVLMDSGGSQAANATLDQSEEYAGTVPDETDSKKTPDSTVADTATQKNKSKTNEQLDDERRRAITEAIKKDKEAKESKKELEYYKNYQSVVKNPQRILEIHASNPEMAEKLANDLYGKSYEDLLEKESKSTYDRNSIEEMVEKALEKRLTKEKSNSVDKEVESFFIGKGITPDNPLFRKINSMFNEIEVKDSKHARIVLNGIYAELNQNSDEVPINNAPSMSYSHSIGGKRKKKVITDGMASLATESGIDLKELEKFFDK